jgi:hypothetical protein
MIDFPSLPSLGLISLGLGLGSLSLGLGVVNESFGLIMTRNVLELASRVMLTIGMAGSYYPLRNIGRPATTVTSEVLRPSLALQRSPRRPARETGMTIGGPVVGSFVKMDPSTTRSFHNQSLHRAGSRGGKIPHHDRIISRHVGLHRLSRPKLINSHPIVVRSCHSHHRHSIKRIYPVWLKRSGVGIE